MNSSVLIIGRGYIGSALFDYLKSIDYDVSSLDWRNGCDYNELTKEILRPYGVIILVAGHSTVPQCLADPYGAWHNNVTKFRDLLEKLQHQVLIYASSSAVYNKCGDVTENNRVFNLTNTLDLTKYTIDQIAQLSGKNYYGLRFGTVAGYSPSPRNDLMLNKMYANRHSGKVFIANPEIRRPILAIADLVRAVEAIIENPINPGIYNLASFTGTVGEMGKEMAKVLDLKVEMLPPTPAYDFEMDTTKFQKMYNFQFKETISSIIQSLKDEKIN